MRRSRTSGVRFTVGLKEEDLEAVDRLSAMWGLGRVGTLRRTVLQVAAQGGASEDRVGVGEAQGFVAVPDVEELLANLKAELRAEMEPLFRKPRGSTSRSTCRLRKRTCDGVFSAMGWPRHVRTTAYSARYHGAGRRSSAAA